MRIRGYGLAATGALVVLTAGCEAVVNAGFDRARPWTSTGDGGGGSDAGGGSGSSGGGGDGGDGGRLSPPDGAILWLRSDVGLMADGTHLSWEDQITKQHATSSDGETGVGSVPAVVPSSSKFNGHDVVRFDGANNRVLLPSVEASFRDGFTAAFVVRGLAKSIYDGFLFLGQRDPRDPQAYKDVIAVGRELDWDRLRFTVQARYRPADWWDGIVQAYGGITTLAPSAEIIVVKQRPDDATVWFYQNGKTIAKDWGDAPLPPDTLRGASYLGWAPTAAFNGEIAEVLLYRRALDDGERVALERYLATKYEVTLASPCADGCPEVLARDQGIPTYIASSGARIAWTNWEGGDVMAIDDVTAAAASPERVFGGGVTSNHPTGPALDRAHVYWGDEVNIHRGSVGGMDHVWASAGGNVQNVVIDDTTAYASLDEAHGIAWISASAWDEASMVSTGNEKVRYVAVDGEFVYWSRVSEDSAKNGVYRSPKATSIDPAMKMLVATTNDPGQIVLDDKYVYIASLDSDGVRRVDKATLGSEEVLVQGIGVGGIAVDGGYLYYTDSRGGAVNRVPIEGGSPTVIADGQAWPFGIAVVGNYLIWANRDGTIVRLQKPS